MDREGCDGALHNLDLYVRQETALRSALSPSAEIDKVTSEWDTKGQVWQRKIAEIWDKPKYIADTKSDTSAGFQMCMPVLCSSNCTDVAFLHLEQDMVGTRCCRSVLQFLLRQVTSIIAQVGIPYMISHGTLLGALRGTEIIAWTRDVDLTVPEKALAFFGTDFGKRALRTAGITSFRDPDAYDNVRICVAASNELFTRDPAARDRTPYDSHYHYVDLYGSRVAKGTFWIPTTALKVPAKSVFPLQQCVIHKFTYPCAVAPEIILAQQYGNAWPLPVATNPSDDANAFATSRTGLAQQDHMDQILEEMITSESRVEAPREAPREAP